VILDTTRKMRLPLADHKVELGEIGLEERRNLKLYDTWRSEWIDLLWDAPIPVKSTGQALMMHYADIEHLENWDALLPFLNLPPKESL
jgi:hypothetical protein